MNSTSIRYIIAFPKNEKKWKYYINDNINDAHIMKKEKFTQFVKLYLKPPTTAIVSQYISKFFNFIIDIENNSVKRLHYDTQKQIDDMVRKFKNEHFQANKIYKNLKTEEQKDKNDMHHNAVEHMVKKFL